jgi:hypothetical protein
LHPRFCRNKKSEAIGKTQPRNLIKASQQATRGGSRRVRANEILRHFIDEFPVRRDIVVSTEQEQHGKPRETLHKSVMRMFID